MKRKPSTRARKRPPIEPLPPQAFDAEARVALVLGDESAWVAALDRGTPTRWTPVRMDQAANAVNRFGADTGLLPDGVLFWQNKRARARLGLWLPPARRTLDFGSGRKPVTVPLPGLVFVGQDTTFWIWAAHARPATLDAPLYHAPLPNVFDDGRVCNGTVDFPKCTPATIAACAQLFFESGFAEHLANGRVQGTDNATDFLHALNGKTSFPLARLVPFGETIGQVIAGETRHRGVRFDPPLGAPDDEEDDADVFMGDGEEHRQLEAA